MKLDKQNREILEFFNISRVQASRAAKSTGYLVPGDVITFWYHGEFRFCIVARTRNKSSIWTSRKGNVLVNCFQIQHLSSETMESVVSRLYKNRKISYQSVTRNLMKFFGRNSFRTFNTLKITDLHEIEFDARNPGDSHLLP